VSWASADAAILDLEGSVSQGDEERAGESLSKLLEELKWKGKGVCAGVNPLTSIEGVKDLIYAAEWNRMSCTVAPKAEGDPVSCTEPRGRT